MNTYGELITPTTLRFERTLPGPIDRVWEYITNAEKRSKWFCGGTTGLNAGDSINFVFQNSQLGSPPEPTPEKYKEYGDGFVSEAVVLKAVKPSLFVIEWEGKVTFELAEEGEMVKLILTHENLADSVDARIGTLGGWHTHLDILVEVVQGIEPKSFWPVHMALEKEYEQRLQ